MERMHLETARKSASDRSAPDTDIMVADARHRKAHAAAPARRPKGRGQGEPWVPSARSFGSFSAAGQKMNIKILNQRALCAAVCR